MNELNSALAQHERAVDNAHAVGAGYLIGAARRLLNGFVLKRHTLSVGDNCNLLVDGEPWYHLRIASQSSELRNTLQAIDDALIASEIPRRYLAGAVLVQKEST